MAMHSNPRTWQLAPGNPAVPEDRRTLDWPGLVSRLVAASDARVAMAHARNFASGEINGSFDADCARLLGRFSGAAGRDETIREYDYPTNPGHVNRVDSGRGKSRSAITGDTAGIVSAGVRGLK